jgi:arylsulfatase A-like enzyme
MNQLITRRDFLKLAGIAPLSVAAPRLVHSLVPVQQSEKVQNVIIIVFDAFSAYNISLYGYQRETTPNIARWAERAVVYHNHHSGGNFTIPGTASLLTGTYPWTHRAFGLSKQTVEKSFVNKNIFSAFQNHYRLAYTHNRVANRILTQFSKTMDEYVPLGRLFLANDDFIDSLFRKDEDTASVSWIRTMKRKEEGYSYSLFMARLYGKRRERVISELQSQFPSGIPHIATDDYFLLEDAIDWLGEKLSTLPQPFMGYFHFLPPHRPYLTHVDFQNRFAKDGYLPVSKPSDKNFQDYNKVQYLLRKRTNYDEYILYADREFGRLMDRLDASGMLENCWVVLTSDHGEMFERGIQGHTTAVLYQPVIRVPLMIFEPGQRSRRDVHENTSAVDLLPTLLHLTGQPPVDWVEGTILPPFAPTEPDPERSLYVVQARKNKQYEPLTAATTALIKGQYKLMYFFGYKELGGVGSERIEMYDLENDPEELNNLYTVKRETATDLLYELKSKIAEVDEPYL